MVVGQGFISNLQVRVLLGGHGKEKHLHWSCFHMGVVVKANFCSEAYCCRELATTKFKLKR